MSELIFLDLETTGLEAKDRICEIGFIANEKSFHTFCKSEKKIGTQAMSVHHITNEMIKDACVCQETQTYKALQSYNSKENVLVAHNINFDLEMLKKEGFEADFEIIDTLRCVKALIPECEQFNLQYLRYELLLYKEEKTLANELGLELQEHRALSDALHTKLLYEVLLQYATLSQLIEISSKPVLMDKLLFGKYRGHYIEEIAELDSSYLHWLMGLEDIDEDLAYSIKQYL